MLLLSALVLLPLLASAKPRSLHLGRENKCTPGEVWADGKIKMECTSRGSKAVGKDWGFYIVRPNLHLKMTFLQRACRMAYLVKTN